MKSYHQLIKLLIRRKLTIATAESCTGGLIAKLITDVSGSSEVFIGGVVSYSNTMKMKWLGVRRETLVKFGAVSEQTVAEMLTGIQKETGADLAIAVSGIAGPTGGTPEKPVGTVFLGIAFREQHILRKYQFAGSRDQVRRQAASKAAELILDQLSRFETEIPFQES
ncbi:MAG: CinA family protein [candidate division KSB1 bacterium]|nr:CinA family protein [candidate division KSB1 bacterium]